MPTPNQASSARQSALRWLMWVIFAVIFIASSTFLLRDSIANKVLKHYFTEQNVSVNCLTTELNWPLSLAINDLCIVTPTLNAHIHDAKWQAKSNTLLIKQMTVQHLLSDSPLPAAQVNELEVALSGINDVLLQLPQFTIRQFTLSSPLLASPVNLLVQLDDTRKLRIAGDVQANMQIQDGKLNTTLNWRLADLQFVPDLKVIIAQNSNIFTANLLDTAVSTTLSFDGLAIDSQHTFALNYPFSAADCELEVLLEGDIGLNIGNIMTSQNMLADLSGLVIQGDLSHCDRLPEQISEWQVNQVSVHVPDTISLLNNTIQVPSLVMQKIGQAAQDTSILLVSLNDLMLNIKQGIASANYDMHFKERLPSKLFTQGKMDFTSRGDVTLNSAPSGSFANTSWILHAANNLDINVLKTDKVEVDKAQSEFTITAQQVGIAELANKRVSDAQNNSAPSSTAQHPKQPAITVQIEGKLNATNTQTSGLQLDSINSNFNASLNPERQFQSNIQLVSNAVKSSLIRVPNMSSQLTLKANMANLTQPTSLSIQGVSKIAPSLVNFDTVNLKLDQLSITHTLSSDLNLASTKSKHDIILGKDFAAQLSQNANNIDLVAADQNVRQLRSILEQLLPDLRLNQGRVSAHVNTKIQSNLQASLVKGELNIQALGGNYANTLFNGGSVNAPFSIDAAGFTLARSAVSIESVNAGVIAENISASLLSEQGSLKLNQVDGTILGGSFTLQNMWLDKRQQRFDLVLQDLDLQKIVALQDQPGIQVLGKMTGRIPMLKTEASIAVDQGRMMSDSGGKLTIHNNPAFDTIKQQQPTLAYLEDYEFSQLSSKVSLQPDGMLLLDLAFTGKNEKSKQAVNFNYNHQENIFDLLKAKRIASGIQDTIERNITQGAKQ